MTRNNIKIYDYESRIAAYALESDRFQLILKHTKELYQLEQGRYAELEDTHSQLQNEILFWLPGYQHYKSDPYIQDQLSSILPDRVNNYDDKELSESDFMFYGDTIRLQKVVDSKVGNHAKLDQATRQVLSLTTQLEILEQRYLKYINGFIDTTW